MPELLLALDVGTTSLGAFVFGPDGTLQGRASAPVASLAPAPGRLEQDAERIWRTALRVARRALAGAGRAAADLAAIGVTTQRTSLVVWDRRTGRPLTPLIVWSDLRGAGRARELQAAGYMVVAQHAAAKLEAAVAAIPDGPALARAGRLAWGNIDSFLIWRLTGGAAHATDRSQAWVTGYLEAGSFGWNPALIEHQGLDRSMFPDLVDTWGPIGATSRNALGAPVPVTAVVADQQAALIGQGGEAPGEAKVTYGTSAALDLSTGGQFLFAGPTMPPFVLSATGGEVRFCLEGMVISAGSALDWVRARFGLGRHARFEALARAAPDAGGAWFLPALQGLGAPHGDGDRRAGLGGLSAATTRAHLARAAMEGVAFRVREVFDALFAAAPFDAPQVLRADGGLTANETFLQIQADILGRPVARHAHREATACGAAICAARGAGVAIDEAGFTRSDRTFEPGPGADQAAERLARWRSQAYGAEA